MGVNSPLFMISIILKLLPLFKDFIIKHYNTIAFIILVVLVIYLFLHARSEHRRADDAEEGLKTAIHISNGLSAENHKYRNKQGDTVLVTTVETIPKSQVEQLLKERDLVWLKKMEGLKKDGTNLESATTFVSEFDGKTLDKFTQIIKIPCADSLRGTEFSIHDQWNDIHATVIGKPTIEIRDRYYASIELQRPKWWFWKLLWSKRVAIGEITNSNKLIRIDSAAVFTVK